LLHLGPRHPFRLVLQPAEPLDELRGQEVAPGGQRLAELDERDPDLVERAAQEAGQPGAALGTGQLRAATAADVGEQTLPQQDPADLRVAAAAVQSAAQPAEQEDRPRGRAAGHEGLGEDEEDHADQQGDGDAEEHEPEPR
jgi:hypothetical protein